MQNTTSQEQSNQNRRTAWAVAVAFAGVVYLVVTVLSALLFGWISMWIPPIIGLVAAFVWTSIAWTGARSAVLDLADVEPADETSHARLFNTAAALSAITGVAPPELYVTDDPAINAMVAGRRPGDASIVVTTGLLEDLDLVELEAVLALLFQRIKSEQIAAETFVVPSVGGLAVLGEQLDNAPALQRILFSTLSLVERVLSKLHPADKEFEADIASTLITQYPPALASALLKMEGRSALAMGAAVSAHLWLAPPLNVALRPSASAVHKPLSERAAVLQEL